MCSLSVDSVSRGQESLIDPAEPIGISCRTGHIRKIMSSLEKEKILLSLKFADRVH